MSGNQSIRVLHLSDLHLTASGRDEDGVDARGSLAGLLHDLRFIEDLDLVVATGDLADDGSVAGYQDALDQLGAFTAGRGIPLICCTGNHDDRTTFAATLGSGHRGPDGTDRGRLLTEGTCRAAVSTVGGLRVITLDSLVPGASHGWLDAGQLTALSRLLAEPAAAGSLVLLHHPPISPPQVSHEVLRNPAELAAVIAGTDVRAVLCGHLHHQLSGSLGGVPVWVTPGVLTRIDLTSPSRLVRAVLGASATLIELAAGAPPVFQTLHARDPAAGDLAYLYDLVTKQYVDTES